MLEKRVQERRSAILVGMSVPPGDVTLLLRKLQAGETDARDRLADLVYAELRRIAAIRMSAEAPGQTLTPTALANEAWLRLADAALSAESRNHFFAIAATAMRRLLIDRARARKSAKREHGVLVPIEEIDIAAPAADTQIVALDEALDSLEGINARAARVTELRYFTGLRHHEIAAILQVDRRTVDRDWAFAKAWLFCRLTGDPGPGSGGQST